MAKDTTIRCSLCGRDKKESKILIAGINGHVCDNCVTQAYSIIKEENAGEQKQLHLQPLLRVVQLKPVLLPLPLVVQR